MTIGKKSFDAAVQSIKQTIEHYALQYFSRSEGKFLTLMLSADLKR
jgi:hypothetical protein